MQFATAFYNRVASVRVPPEEMAFDAVDFTPVHGVTVALSASSHGVFTVEWKDEREQPAVRDGSGPAGVPCRSSAQVLSEDAVCHKCGVAAPAPNAGSGSVTVPGVADMVAILHQIVFAGSHQSVTEMAEALSAEGEAGLAVQREPVMIHLQQAHDRAAMRRVTVTTDGKGQLTQFTVSNGSALQLNFKNARALAVTLNEMCSGENSFVFVRAAKW